MAQRTVLQCSLFLAVFGVITVPPASLGAQTTFTYRHFAGDQWHLTSLVQEEVLINGELFYQTEILNKISAEVLQGDGGAGRLRNLYQIAEKAVNDPVYSWSAEYEAVYDRNTRGRLSRFRGDPQVPTVRNVPVYPEGEVNEGAAWEADGQEVFDLRPGYGIDEIVVVDFTAAYQYLGAVQRENRIMDRVLVTYGYQWFPDAETLSRLARYGEYPESIVGEFRQTIIWDRASGRNFMADGEFSYTYSLNVGRTYTFRGNTTGRAIYVEPLDKERLVEEVESLADDDLRAVVTEEGVSISLENIHFVPDQPAMLPGEEEALQRIGEILARYPQRDILIIGHTARIPGAGDGQRLSEQRANTVARHIIDSGIRSPTQVITRGLGDSKPIGDNATEAGRRRNRRVEIVVLEN